MTEPLLLRVWPDAGNALGLGRTKMFALISSGELASVQVGRRRLIPSSAIQDYVKRLTPRPSSHERSLKASAVAGTHSVRWVGDEEAASWQRSPAVWVALAAEIYQEAWEAGEDPAEAVRVALDVPKADERPFLTEQEKADLLERARQRMAEPGYRESLVDPPADVRGSCPTCGAPLSAQRQGHPGST